MVLAAMGGCAIVADLALLEAVPGLLPGLLHYLYRYGVAFCPHGENTVVIFDDRDVPARIAVRNASASVSASVFPVSWRPTRRSRLNRLPVGLLR